MSEYDLLFDEIDFKPEYDLDHMHIPLVDGKTDWKGIASALRSSQTVYLDSIEGISGFSGKWSDLVAKILPYLPEFRANLAFVINSKRLNNRKGILLSEIENSPGIVTSDQCFVFDLTTEPVTEGFFEYLARPVLYDYEGKIQNVLDQYFNNRTANLMSTVNIIETTLREYQEAWTVGLTQIQ